MGELGMRALHAIGIATIEFKAMGDAETTELKTLIRRLPGVTENMMHYEYTFIVGGEKVEDKPAKAKS
jgi:hypothetical protein